MDEHEWTATTEQVWRAHDDIRRLHERGQLILGAGLAAAGLSIPIISRAPDIGFALSEVLFTFAFAWYLNLNAESASIAEVRDYLAENANQRTTDRPFRFTEIGEVGRGHPATVLTGILPVGVLVGFAVAGGLNAFGLINWSHSDYTFPRWTAILTWSVVTTLCLVAFVAAGVAESDYRERMRVPPVGRRPSSHELPSFGGRLVRLVFRRDRQGWDKERAIANQSDSPPTQRLPGSIRRPQGNLRSLQVNRPRTEVDKCTT